MKKSRRKKFKIGDKIKIIAPGQIYSTYKAMAILLGADVKGGKWRSRSISEGNYAFKQTGHVLNMSDEGHILIELDSGKQWIVAPAGLKKIDVILPEDLFEI